MKSIYHVILATCALSLSLSTLAHAQLPPEVQADLLQKKIVTSLQSKDFDAVKSQISEYKELGISVPPAILLIDAKISISDKKWRSAQSKLEAYFTEVGKTHASYNEALSLYETVDTEVGNLDSRLASQLQAMFDFVKKMENGLTFENTIGDETYGQALSKKFDVGASYDRLTTINVMHFDDGLAITSWDGVPHQCVMQLTRSVDFRLDKRFRNTDSNSAVGDLEFQTESGYPVKIHFPDPDTNSISISQEIFNIEERDSYPFKQLGKTNFFVLKMGVTEIPYNSLAGANRAAQNFKELSAMCAAYLDMSR